MLCSYGCGQKAIKQFNNGMYCCRETYKSCPEIVRKIVEKLTGRTKENDKGRRKQAEKITGENNPNFGKSGYWAGKKNPDQSFFMKNGGSAHSNSFIKDNSKPENELFVLTCKILPRPIHKYPIYRVGKGKKSYNVDIADPSLGIILEYDGYYHFYKEDRKEYDIKRQKEIEEDGWKFLRYNIFQKFPTLEQLREDIQKVLNGVNQCQVY